MKDEGFVGEFGLRLDYKNKTKQWRQESATFSKLINN